MEENKMENEFKEIDAGSVIQFEKENDSVQGVLKARVSGQYGDNYILEVMENDVLVEKTLFGGTVINTKMSRVKDGEEVRVTYVGEIKSSNGRMYKDFKVERRTN